MNQPFDTSTKELFETWPEACFQITGWVLDAPLELVNADLNTVVASADKVIKVLAKHHWLVHLEFQSSRDPTLPARLFRYNALLYHRHQLPVVSVVILLRPEADGPELQSGELRLREPGQPGHLVFPFEVVRIWTHPVETLLRGELGLLPLAVLTDDSHVNVSEVVARIDQRIRREAAPGQAATLWSTVWLLLGLRHPEELASELLRGIPMIDLRDSSTYQAAVREGQRVGLQQGLEQGLQQGLQDGLQEGSRLGLAQGKLAEARKFLMLVARKRFGEPDSATLAFLESVQDLECLEQMGERVIDAASWADVIEPFRTA